ncbi:MAG TPA: 3,4-dihydroxy-2-butanone-4-phosphate synthase [Solirubrobacterales bacterium]|nr:3,4-dihydroxy-2-butanone-4-phosphate synthase [Solirubrobacterales bacterium]
MQRPDTVAKVAAGAIAAGEAVVMLEPTAEGAVGYLVAAAALADAATVRLMSANGDGLLRVALPAARGDELHLDSISPDRSLSWRGTRECLGIDLVAQDQRPSSMSGRAATVRALALAEPEHVRFERPGRVFPLVVGEEGTGSPFDAALRLVESTRLPGAAVICEVGAPGASSFDALIAFARLNRLATISVEEIGEVGVRLLSARVEARIPFDGSVWRAVAYLDDEGREHLALVLGELDAHPDPVPLHIHRACLLGDALGSAACPCGSRLRSALAELTRQGRGVLLYLRAEDEKDVGRSIDHAPREHGLDIAVEILARLRLGRVSLLDRLPVDVARLREAGLID